MIPTWVLFVAVFFTVLLAVVIVLLVRLVTSMEIIIRAIPFGAPKIQERRPPAPPQEQRTRPVGATATAQHRGRE